MVNNLVNKDKEIFLENKFIESSYSFSVEEQKVIRILASMIKKGDSEFKEYNFRVLELAEFLGMNKKSAYRQMEELAESLMSRYIKIN